jgi:hypothetical protein
LPVSSRASQYFRHFPWKPTHCLGGVRVRVRCRDRVLPWMATPSHRE